LSNYDGTGTGSSKHDSTGKVQAKGHENNKEPVWNFEWYLKKKYISVPEGSSPKMSGPERK